MEEWGKLPNSLGLFTEVERKDLVRKVASFLYYPKKRQAMPRKKFLIYLVAKRLAALESAGKDNQAPEWLDLYGRFKAMGGFSLLIEANSDAYLGQRKIDKVWSAWWT